MRQFSVLVTFLKSTHNSKLVEFRSSNCIIQWRQVDQKSGGPAGQAVVLVLVY